MAGSQLWLAVNCSPTKISIVHLVCVYRCCSTVSHSCLPTIWREQRLYSADQFILCYFHEWIWMTLIQLYSNQILSNKSNTYRNIQAASVPSFLNAPIFGLYFASCWNISIELGFRYDQWELTFSKSCCLVSVRRWTSCDLLIIIEKWVQTKEREREKISNHFTLNL